MVKYNSRGKLRRSGYIAILWTVLLEFHTNPILGTGLDTLWVGLRPIWA
jgi:hypothetical protein